LILISFHGDFNDLEFLLTSKINEGNFVFNYHQQLQRTFTVLICFIAQINHPVKKLVPLTEKLNRISKVAFICITKMTEQATG
jgi:hypothetical protein